MNERADDMHGAMSPVDDGALRAYLDGDPVLDDAARVQIAALVAQPALAARLAALRTDATAVDDAFAGLAAPEPDAAHLAHAYRRIQTRLAAENHTGLMESIKERFAAMTSYNRGARARRYVFAGGLGAVALVCLLIFAPVTQAFDAVINTFSYHPTKVSVITINTSNFPQFQNGPLNGSGTPATGAKPATGSKPASSPTAQDQQQLMQELSKYVSVTSSIGQGQLPGREVANAAAAQQVVGRAVSAPTTLPSGVANTPKYYVSDHETADATLHLNEIRPTLTQLGMASLIPATGDSATVHVDAPPASIVSYGFDPTAQGAAAQNQKGVAVIAMASPTITVNGLDVPGIVDVLGTLPNIPADLVAQLKAADLQHTLIIPVTDQQVVTHGAINAGSTTISQKDGSMSAVIWITNDNGTDILHVAVGSYDGKTVESVAKSVK